MKIGDFHAAGAVADLEAEDTDDVALVVAPHAVVAAGVFTVNAVKAAPILWDIERLADPTARFRAVVANSGNANACTGDSGPRATLAMAEEAAARVGCRPEEVLVLSTGVIGVPMDVPRVQRRIGQAAARLHAGGWKEAAVAMMTTDRAPKTAIRSVAGMTVGGIAKGAGMIAPNMATMLAVLATDADLDRPTLDALLRRTNNASFQRIVVDGDMSTNDAVVALADGSSGIRPEGDTFEALALAFDEVAIELATLIVRDGEGATKLVRIEVEGAEDAVVAEAVARAIGVSPLCKTAFHGADPNWGRVVAAAGATIALLGRRLDPAGLAVSLERDGAVMPLLVGGEPTSFDEAEASRWMSGDTWTVRVGLGTGPASTWLWTCDLTAAYIAINSHYRT
jgi:glutamate N-acetyltransferase/amino-acid N-acetyltransferase